MIKLDISETELWNRFENGDVKAFSIIYEHHVDDMFRYGMKICGDKEVALDSIHDVFVKIFSTHKVHSQIRNPKAYLLKALRGQIYDNMRHEKRLPTIGIDVLPFNVEWELSERVENDKETREKIECQYRQAISGMTARQKEAVYLRYTMELSYEDISVLMNMSVQSLRNLLSRTMLKIRKIMPIFIFLQYFSS